MSVSAILSGFRKNDDLFTVTPPTHRVQFSLREEADNECKLKITNLGLSSINYSTNTQTKALKSSRLGPHKSNFKSLSS